MNSHLPIVQQHQVDHYVRVINPQCIYLRPSMNVQVLNLLRLFQPIPMIARQIELDDLSLILMDSSFVCKLFICINKTKIYTMYFCPTLKLNLLCVVVHHLNPTRNWCYFALLINSAFPKKQTNFGKIDTTHYIEKNIE